MAKDKRVHINVTCPTVVLENWRDNQTEGGDVKMKVDGLRNKGLHLDCKEYRDGQDLKRTLERRTDIPAKYWQVKDSKGRAIGKTKPGGRYSASPVNPDEGTSSDEESDEDLMVKQYEEKLSQKLADDSGTSTSEDDSDDNT